VTAAETWRNDAQRFPTRNFDVLVRAGELLDRLDQVVFALHRSGLLGRNQRAVHHDLQYRAVRQIIRACTSAEAVWGKAAVLELTNGEKPHLRRLDMYVRV
jgi:hypothetical protein